MRDLWTGFWIGLLVSFLVWRLAETAWNIIQLFWRR